MKKRFLWFLAMALVFLVPQTGMVPAAFGEEVPQMEEVVVTATKSRKKGETSPMRS